MELCCFESCDQEGEILFIHHDQYFCRYHAVDSIISETNNNSLKENEIAAIAGNIASAENFWLRRLNGP